MKTKVLLSLLILLFIPQTIFGYTGREIIEKAKANIDKMNKQPSPETTKVRVIMQIYEKNERIEREFEVMSKRSITRGKALISFIRPSKMKILAHLHKDGNQDIWMKMSSGKIRKVNIDEKRPMPILSDSHFTFEDLDMEILGNLGLNFNNLNFDIKNIDNRLDDYDFKHLGDIKVAESECYKVESVLKKEDFDYNKVIYYFRKSDFYLIRIDFFKKEKFYKYLELYDLKEVDGFQIPFRAVMTMAGRTDRTELRIQAIKFNTKISNSRFNKNSL